MVKRLIDVVLWLKTRNPRQRAYLRNLLAEAAREQTSSEAESFAPASLAPETPSAMSVHALVERFVELAIARHEALGIMAQDRVYWQIDEVSGELKRRDGDVRSALLALYAHPDMRVRAEAAEWTRTFVPDIARDRLWTIDHPGWPLPPGDPPRRSLILDLTIEQLVARFVALSLAQDKALVAGRIPAFNMRYGLVEAVVEELAARGIAAQRRLIPLLAHENPQIRLRAAQALRRDEPALARATFENLIARDEYPQAADARGALKAMEDE